MNVTLQICSYGGTLDDHFNGIFACVSHSHLAQFQASVAHHLHPAHHIKVLKKIMKESWIAMGRLGQKGGQRTHNL
jgi:hypothetical protein